MVHFPTLNTLLPAETLPGKMQLSFSSSFAAVMPKQKVTKMGPSTTSGKIKKLIQQNLREEYQTNIHVNSCLVVPDNMVMYAAF